MKFLGILLFLLFSSVVIGQADIVTIEGSRYYYKGEEYKRSELGPIYKQSEEAYQLYNSGIMFSKISKVTVDIGLVALGVGIFFASGRDWNAAVPAFYSAIGIGILAIIPKINSSLKMSSARQTFNFEILEREGYNSSYSLDIGGVTNGIGLFFNF